MSIALRVAVMVLRVVLAGLLLRLVLGRRRDLPPSVARCWAIVLVAVVVAAINGVIPEALAYGAHAMPDAIPWRPVRVHFFNFAYMTNAAVAAMLPAALLALLLKRTLPGRVAAAIVLAVPVVVMGAAIGGRHSSWEGLLLNASTIEILALALWVAFFVAYFLGHLPRVDGYLAAFLSVGAVFVMLTPLPETVFRIVGREGATEIWTITLVFQAARYGLQCVIVALLLRTLRSGRALGRGPALSPPATA